MIDPLPPRSGNGCARSGVFPQALRLRRAAWAFTTRRVRGEPPALTDDGRSPSPGDLVLARVDAIGYHSALQLPDGRRKRLFVGDEIVVVYGNRYAPNQFEAVVPRTLGPCQLVAAGGVAGKVLSGHASITKNPTQITPLCLLAGSHGGPANLRDYALPGVERIPSPHPTVVAVAGTSMDSGKTETCAFLVRGLTAAGLKVAYAKITGTGAGGDTWLLRDAGAQPVLDFTDAGLVSTYLAPEDEIRRAFVTLVAHLSRTRVSAIVLEIADGVLQGETARLLTSPVFRETVGGVVFTACDAMGAVAGQGWLRARNLPLVALSGVMTSSPLQRVEATRTTGLPVFSRQDLAEERTALEILARAGELGRETRRLTRPRSLRNRLEPLLRISVVPEPSDTPLAARVGETE